MSENEAPRRPCVRCLTADLPEGEALSAILRERVAQLSEEERVPEKTYRARLNRCIGCERLNRGTCAMCGCYVEVRAARRAKDCPEHRWARY